MEIHDGDFWPVWFGQNPIRGTEGAVQAFQINGAHQVDHLHLEPAQIDQAGTPAGRSPFREVGGPQHIGMLLVQSIAFFPTESVVPGSNHIHTAVEQITGGGGGKPVAVGGIFPVGDDQVNAFQLFQRRQTLSEKLAANAANHVADTKNIHSGFTFLWRSSGRPGSRRENLKMGQSAGRKSLSPRK